MKKSVATILSAALTAASWGLAPYEALAQLQLTLPTQPLAAPAPVALGLGALGPSGLDTGSADAPLPALGLPGEGLESLRRLERLGPLEEISPSREGDKKETIPTEEDGAELGKILFDRGLKREGGDARAPIQAPGMGEGAIELPSVAGSKGRRMVFSSERGSTPAELNAVSYEGSGGRRPKTWVFVVAGIALAIAATVFIIWKNSQDKNAQFEKSKTFQEIVLVEKSRRSGDEGTLERVAQDAYGRRERMRERIADAKSKGDKKVDDKTKDSIKEAEAYAAFDGLVGGRALLNHNAVSKDPAKRMGEDLPATWKSEVQGLEAQAKAASEDPSRASGAEGALALNLKALGAELGRQGQKASQIGGDLKDFGDKVPGMFGGKMKEHQARGERDLAEFRGSEMVPEEGLLAAANQAMRERVSDRLYRESGDFKAHRDRMDRLAETLESKVKPVADIARSIDKDLQDMAEARRLEAYYLLMASQHENDPVYNDKGEVTGYEDNSGMWKTMAATQASQAQSKAAGANAGLRAMKALLTPLYKDPVLKAEGLVFALPNGADQRVSEGHGIFWDIFMPSLFSFFSNMGSQSQANEARAKFSPVLASLQSVESELNSRRAAEASSVNGAVTADLDRQMRQVPAER